MDDLKIRVISHLSTTQQVLLYQQDIDLNVKTYLVAAWEHPYIAPKARFDVCLPISVAVRARTSVGKGVMTTRELEADYNTAWDICENDRGLDIRKSRDEPPTENTIEINNKCSETKVAVVTKNSKPLFACDVRPDFKVNFAVKPRLYVALSDMDIHDEFFDAATLSKKPLQIDYEGQQYVTIHLDENVSTGLVSLTYEFNKFE